MKCSILNSLLKGFYSIGEGLASISIFPNYNQKILTEQEASEKDYNSLKSDWDAVGNDLEKAIRSFEKRDC